MKTLHSGVIGEVPPNSSIKKGWEVKICHDEEDTKGFYLFFSNPDNPNEGFDNWYLKKDDAFHQLSTDNIEVEWDANLCQLKAYISELAQCLKQRNKTDTANFFTRVLEKLDDEANTHKEIKSLTTIAAMGQYASLNYQEDELLHQIILEAQLLSKGM